MPLGKGTGYRINLLRPEAGLGKIFRLTSLPQGWRKEWLPEFESGAKP